MKNPQSPTSLPLPLDVSVLSNRIKACDKTLCELKNRPGGPKWLEALEMVRPDINLALDHLEGFKDAMKDPPWESVPLERKFTRLTTDSMSFQNIDTDVEVEIPYGDHVGAFGAARKSPAHGGYVHKGVDLYAAVGTPVFTVEDGIVVRNGPFTGIAAGSEWWLPTSAMYVAGKSGVVVYGEIETCAFEIGETVKAGEFIGCVIRVLKKDKGRPTSMLHFAMLRHGCLGAGEWEIDKPQPYNLVDPTPYLATLIED